MTQPEPHVHHVSEAALWWADCFPQWKGKDRNAIHEPDPDVPQDQ